MRDLWKLSAVDMAAGIRNRDFKPSEVVTSAVARVEEQNLHLNAITLNLTEQATPTARTADQVIVELVRDAAAQLRDAGYKIVEVDPPPVIEPAAEWFRPYTTEMKTTFDAGLRQYGSETINQIFEWYYQMSELLNRDGYITAFADRTRMMRAWNLFLADYPLVLTPFLMRPMYDWDYDTLGFDQVKDLFDSAIYSTGINYLGLPAGAIGMTMVENRPAAIQIVGQRYREDLICNAMEAIEDRNGVLVHQLWEHIKQN